MASLVGTGEGKQEEAREDKGRARAPRPGVGARSGEAKGPPRATVSGAKGATARQAGEPALQPHTQTDSDVKSSGSSSARSASSTMRRNSVVVKVGMVSKPELCAREGVTLQVGDAQVGKTSLMVKYVEGKFDADYIETLGVNFMEKNIRLRTAEVTFSVWDLGGGNSRVRG